MIVTRNRTFAVTQPGDTVVSENSLDAAAAGETIEARYELLARGVYSSSNTKSKTPFSASIAKRRSNSSKRERRSHCSQCRAEKYAGPSLTKAAQQLASAEDLYRQKRDKNPLPPPRAIPCKPQRKLASSP